MTSTGSCSSGTLRILLENPHSFKDLCSYLPHPNPLRAASRILQRACDAHIVDPLPKLLADRRIRALAPYFFNPDYFHMQLVVREAHIYSRVEELINALPQILQTPFSETQEVISSTELFHAVLEMSMQISTIRTSGALGGAALEADKDLLSQFELAQAYLRSTFVKTTTHLDLTNRKITVLCPDIKHLSSLRNLCLNDNHIVSLPRELCELANLQILQAKNNTISFLSEGLGNLSQIQQLDLPGNRLFKLPRDIQHWKELKSVNLTSNRFKNVPKTLCKIPSLEILQLSDNPLHTLRPKLAELPKLKRLELPLALKEAFPANNPKLATKIEINVFL